MLPKFNAFVTSPEAALRFRKQCLKSKNILFENDALQIASKISPFYDFYTSTNYIQLQIFIGNKTHKKIQNFSLNFRGTRNLELFIEPVQKVISDNTQFKQRILIDCNSLQEEILLLFDFRSDILTLTSAPIPLTLYSFCAFKPQQICTLPLTASYSQLADLLSSRYQYIEQMEITVNIGIFKKGLLKEGQKYFTSLTPHTENLLVGEFTMKDLTDDYALAILINDDMRMNLLICGNKYDHFDSIFSNLKFLISNQLR